MTRSTQSPSLLPAAVAALSLAAALALVAAFAPGAARAAGDGELEDPYDVEPGRRLDVLVERMRLEQEATRTLEASFVQRKESALLLEPDLATGVFFYAAPDNVRWEYDDPTPISLLITGDHMRTWYRDLGQVEEVEIGRHSQRILEYLGAGSSLATLVEYFDVRLTLPGDRSRPLHLDLDPKFERVARRLQGMNIWVDSTTYLPVKLRYVEADGDVTEYEFSDFRVNGEISSDRFELDLPADVHVRTIDLNRGLR
ncbi:MAG: outer membrane lipoprotein carrier protein LolA [Acidobacteriota bacterium]|nr:outer membrane lipoprotein carrier protein LolA [Acidobacteriota bacterium]MDH3523660.1 outer membrane lipoprotein carrier protein LolA [Acidobacteriota bacterium]